MLLLTPPSRDLSGRGVEMMAVAKLQGMGRGTKIVMGMESMCTNSCMFLSRRTATLLSLPALSLSLINRPIVGVEAQDKLKPEGSPLRFDPVTSTEKEASKAFASKVLEAVELLEKGRQLQSQSNFREALNCFTQVIELYGDLALAEYARVGRAISLYEVGDREESISEMEDVSISLKGYPEIHAALAAAFYVDKQSPLLAEQQFTIATLLDPRYTDLSYVRDTRHWPPSLIASLEKFINLS